MDERADMAAETMAEARARYFRDNQFGDDGGYGDTWVDLKIGPLHVPFPNTAGRVEAVRYHDLHHIVTGYATDVRGEAEIGAWELGAGCKGSGAAWFLNLGVMVFGGALAPRRVYRAFVRGRRSDSLYGRPFEPLLGASVGDVKKLTRVSEADADPRPGSALDRALFGAALAAGSVAMVVGVAIGAALLPFGLAALAARKASQRAAAGAPRTRT